MEVFMFVVVDFKTYCFLFIVSLIVCLIWIFIIKPIIGHNSKDNLKKEKCPYCNKIVESGEYYCKYCRCLTASDELKKFIAENHYQYIVIEDIIEINDIPSVAGKHLFSLVKNDIVFLIKLGEKIIDDRIWVQIRTNDGKIGWTAYKYLKKIKE
jgi:hypothetical protein